MSDLPIWKRNKVARNAAYNAANYSRVVMEIPKDKKARLQALAAEQGLPLTGLIMTCVEQVTGRGHCGRYYHHGLRQGRMT